MSLTIDGATNTITAPSGLAIAGNTAITGTLSATGNGSVGSGGTNAYLEVKSSVNAGGAGSSDVRFSAANSAARGYINYAYATDNMEFYTAGGAGSMTLNSTGLAVTGTLSATSAITATSAAQPFVANSSNNAQNYNGLINFQRQTVVKGYLALDTSDNMVFLTSGAAPIATLSSTALTLGSGVNLTIAKTQGILANDTDGYVVYGGSTTIATGATLVVYGETHVSTPNEAQFRVNNTTKMTVASSAVTLGTGVNLVMASGQGIDFSATANGSGTVTSEVLSDYEEGTWTPTIIGLSTAGAGTYTTQAARYTKIGRTVHVHGSIGWSAHTGTGDMAIDGLPFTPVVANTAGLYAPAALISYNLTLPASNVLGGYVGINTPRIVLISLPVAGGAYASLAIDTAVTELQFNATYTV